MNSENERADNESRQAQVAQQEAADRQAKVIMAKLLGDESVEEMAEDRFPVTAAEELVQMKLDLNHTGGWPNWQTSAEFLRDVSPIPKRESVRDHGSIQPTEPVAALVCSKEDIVDRLTGKGCDEALAESIAGTMIEEFRKGIFDNCSIVLWTTIAKWRIKSESASPDAAASFASGLMTMIHRHWAAGLPGDPGPFIPAKVKAMLGMLLIRRAVLDCLHGEMGRGFSPDEIAEELGLGDDGAYFGDSRRKCHFTGARMCGKAADALVKTNEFVEAPEGRDGGGRRFWHHILEY